MALDRFLMLAMASLRTPRVHKRVHIGAMPLWAMVIGTLSTVV